MKLVLLRTSYKTPNVIQNSDTCNLRKIFNYISTQNFLFNTHREGNCIVQN